MAVRREVKVRERTTGQDRTGHHLGDRVGRDSRAHDSVKEARERGDDRPEEEGDDVAPDGEGRVTYGDRDDSKGRAEDEAREIPPLKRERKEKIVS